MQEDPTRPLSIAERLAAARALEAIADALTDAKLPTLSRGPVLELLGKVHDMAVRCALDLRRGHRAEDIDTVMRELLAFVEMMPEGEGPPHIIIVPGRWPQT